MRVRRVGFDGFGSEIETCFGPRARAVVLGGPLWELWRITVRVTARFSIVSYAPSRLPSAPTPELREHHIEHVGGRQEGGAEVVRPLLSTLTYAAILQ